MKRRVGALAACLVLLALVSPSLLAQANGLQPDRGEIESAKSANIVFVNYEGPTSRIDSLAEIKGIGAALAAKTRYTGNPVRPAVIAAAATPYPGFDDGRLQVLVTG